MRVCTYTWPFSFGVRLGWATRVPNPDPRTACGRVYLLRGNGIFFSRGLGVLCGQLRAGGIWAEDLRCVGDRWAIRHLRADHRAGRLGGPVVFVGHSCGGRYSLFAARELQALGIAVDLIVCLDVALPLPVPPNVKRAVHLFRSRWRLYPAGPLRAAADSSAAIENIDLDADDSPVRRAWLHHLNFTDDPAVQGIVLQRIAEVVGTSSRLPAG
jgi:hypothetical protein